MRASNVSIRYRALPSLYSAALVMLLCALQASAATFTVINTNDAGAGSLRQAVIDANVLAGADVIAFSLPAGPQTITLTTGQLPIFDHVTITGPGAQLLTISGNDADRVFDIALSRNVSISGLSIVHGRRVTGGWEDQAGAGIRSRGNLTLTDCVMSNNSASINGSAVAVFEANTGTTPHTEISGCTFANNTCTGAGNGGAVCNGSFYNGFTSACTMQVSNSTFTGNSGTVTDFWGGALANSGTWLKVINCTVTGNTANEGGGIFAYRGTVSVLNSIVAGNTAVAAPPSPANGPDVAMFVGGPVSIVSLGNNLIGDNTGTASASFTNGTLGNIVGTAPSVVDPMLAAAALNGGTTPTCALLCGSPAVDAGSNAVMGAPYLLTADQRGGGYPRLAHGTVDIGAYESPYPIETVPPTITVTLDPSVLWPPNHRMVAIQAAVTVTDNCPGALTYKLISITSSESDNGLGDGDRPNDIQGTQVNTPDLLFTLRAERSGTGSGRTYTVTYEATDASGNTATASATVTVPHSSPKEGATGIVSALPMDLELEQNYPNPFNPTTTIRYALPAPTHAVLKVFDASMREVATLVDRMQDAGAHTVQFSADQLPSGEYYYRLDAGGKTQMQRMSLLK